MMAGNSRPLWAVIVIGIAMAVSPPADVLSLHYFENYISFLHVNLCCWRKKYGREVCSKILDPIQVKT